jgi:hypothetical protein
MADKKISQLTALSAVNLAPSTDVLAIVDTSATETKKIVAQDLVNGVLNVASAVGIGTSSPAYKLDVNTGQIRANESSTGSGDGGLISGTVSANGNAGVLFQTNGASRWNLTTLGTNGASLRIYNYALASTVATFDSSGNLGLGVTPSAWTGSGGKNIEIGATGNAIFGSGSLTTYTYNANFDSSWKYSRSDFASRYEQQTGTHRWYIAPSGTAGNAISFTQAMTLDADGDLLVGNTASVQSSRAEFTSTSLTPAFLARVNANSDEGQWAGQFQKKTATNTTSQIFVRFLINDGAAASGYITANGASAATFTSSSDVRLKENIAELPSQWSSIKALRPVEFDYIESEGGGHQIGFIAQDFEQVYPDSVGERPDGMKMLSGWSKTEARMVKALQEAMCRIEQLEAKVAALEAK